MFIPLKDLNNMRPNIETERTCIYFFNSDYVGIRFKNLTDQEKRKMQKRFDYVREIGNIDHMTLPVDVLETEKGVCGYIERNVYGLDNNLIPFADYYNANPNITLDKISAYTLNCIEISDTATSHDIVIPDMPTGGNVLYNPDTEGVTFLDYQGMQVKDIATPCVNSFIAIDPIIYKSKYCNGDMWTENLNNYILAIRYFYYATKVNLPRASVTRFPLDVLLDNSGLTNTALGDYLKTVYDENSQNGSLKEVVEEMNRNYIISEYVPDEQRVFIKK